MKILSLAVVWCALALASCSEDDTNGGEQSASATSGSSSGSTGSGATGGAGAQAGGAGGTGAAATGGGGSSGGAPGACDGDALVSGDGCGSGKCSLQFSLQGMVVVGCCPAGNVAEGATCSPAKNDSQDHPDFKCDDCAVGLVCVDFVCRYYCD